MEEHTSTILLCALFLIPIPVYLTRIRIYQQDEQLFSYYLSKSS